MSATLLGFTGLLFVASTAMAMRGHRFDWFWWTLLTSVGSAHAAVLMPDPKVRGAIRVLSFAASGVTCIGLGFAFFHLPVA